MYMPAGRMKRHIHIYARDGQAYTGRCLHIDVYASRDSPI